MHGAVGELSLLAEEAASFSAATAALCSEMAENVQKVTLVGYIDFGSSWLLFGEFT